MDNTEISQEVDARGQKCPIPILWAKKALSAMESGQILRILATDPAVAGDFHFFSRQTGNTLLAQTESDGEYTICLKKK